MNYLIPEKMQAIQVQNPGKHSRLQWCALPVPKPAAGQLLLKVAACGVNRADLMQRQGLYPPPEGDSDILGLEAAGTVVAVGDESLSAYFGQRYFGLVNGGAMLNMCCCRQHRPCRCLLAGLWCKPRQQQKRF